MVRRGTVGMVRGGTVGMVRRGTVGYGAAWHSCYSAAWHSWYGAAWHSWQWCGVVQLVARRLAGRQARVRYSARHHREVCPTELTSDEEIEGGLGECIV
jgi:hypothetical protein